MHSRESDLFFPHLSVHTCSRRRSRWVDPVMGREWANTAFHRYQTVYYPLDLSDCFGISLQISDQSKPTFCSGVSPALFKHEAHHEPAGLNLGKNKLTFLFSHAAPPDQIPIVRLQRVEGPDSQANVTAPHLKSTRTFYLNSTCDKGPSKISWCIFFFCSFDKQPER